MRRFFIASLIVSLFSIAWYRHIRSLDQEIDNKLYESAGISISEPVKEAWDALIETNSPKYAIDMAYDRALGQLIDDGTIKDENMEIYMSQEYRNKYHKTICQKLGTSQYYPLSKDSMQSIEWYHVMAWKMIIIEHQSKQ